MARITTGNTDILRDYYDLREGTYDVFATVYLALESHWFQDQLDRVDTQEFNSASLSYNSGGYIFRLEGENLDQANPEDWRVSKIDALFSDAGDRIVLLGNMALTADYKLAPGSTASDITVLDPAGGSQLLNPDARPTSAQLLGNLEIDTNGNPFARIVYTEKSASWDDGLKLRLLGQTLDSNESGSPEKIQTIHTVIVENNGVETFRIDDFGFVDSTLTDEILESGVEAFIEHFLSGDDTVTGTTSDDSYLYAGAGDDVVDGGSGDDLLIGGSGLGNDTYIGGTGTDTVKYTSATAGIRVDLSKGTAASISGDAASIGRDQLSGIENIIGGQYDDILVGDAQANRLEGGSGSDQLDGGSGIDTAAYSGSRLTMSRSGDQWQVAGDTLTNIERVEFDNGAIGLDDISEKAYRIYKAAFDRTPDEEGLGYWIQELDKGFALHQVTNSFVISQEFKNLYGADLNNEGFITALYNNVLDRDPDQGGLDYWINDMENNGMSRADVLASFSESAENIANTDPLIELGVLYQPYDLLG